MSQESSGPDPVTLRTRLLRFIDRSGADDFDSLALEIFRHQWRWNRPYRRLIGEKLRSPDEVRTWREIPAVSTVAFKSLTLTTGTPALFFRTSGTTHGAERQGTHYLLDTDLYRAALRRSFRDFVLPDLAAGERMRLFVLAPTPAWAPHSSLGFMLSDLLESCGAPGSGVYLDQDGLASEALFESLVAARREGTPVALLGTALAFVHLLEWMTRGNHFIPLPPGSRIMDTGGFKGRVREVARSELLEGYRVRLGVPADRVVNEYGMTEMSSQFYDASLRGGDPEVKLGPHWVRTRIIDPASGRELPVGRPGLLLHVDLANLDSVVAVETEDLGMARDEGFVLLGRATGAEPRGCSIAADELLERGQ